MKISQTNSEQAETWQRALVDRNAWHGGNRPLLDVGDCRLVCKGGDEVTWHKVLLAQWSGLVADLLLAGAVADGASGCRDCSLLLKYDAILLPDFDAGLVRKVLAWTATGMATLSGVGEAEQVRDLLRSLRATIHSKDITCEAAEEEETVQVATCDFCGQDLGSKEALDEHVASCQRLVIKQEVEDVDGENADTVESKHDGENKEQQGDHGDDDPAVAVHDVKAKPKKIRKKASSNKARTAGASVQCLSCPRMIRGGPFHVLAHYSIMHHRGEIVSSADGARAVASSLVWTAEKGKRYRCVLCPASRPAPSVDLANFVVHLGVVHEMVLPHLPKEVGTVMFPLICKKEKEEKTRPKSTAVLAKKRKVDGKMRNKFACSLCGKGQRDHSEYRAHLTRHHYSTEVADACADALAASVCGGENGDRKTFRCSLCADEGNAAIFDCHSAFVVHLGNTHRKVLPLLEEDVRKVAAGGRENVVDLKDPVKLVRPKLVSVRPHKNPDGRCHLCQKHVSGTSRMSWHLLDHHFKARFAEDHADVIARSVKVGYRCGYKCPVCGVSNAGDKWDLMRHLAHNHRFILKYLGDDSEQVVFPGKSKTKKNTEKAIDN